MIPRITALVAAIASTAAVYAAVDPEQRNEPLASAPSEQPQFPKKRATVAKARNASETAVRPATAPLAEIRAPLAGVRPRKTAPVAMEPRAVPRSKPAPARISTGQPAPAKFSTQLQPPKVARIQDGMNDARNVEKPKVAPGTRRARIDRINRFVFRRNEPEPGVAAAGGGSPPAPAEPK